MTQNSLKGLINHLESTGVLISSKVKEALEKVDRKNFVPKHLQYLAYKDHPIVLAEGKTISQPKTVAFMLELLSVQEGQKVLDIGAGSGWVSCLLGYLVGEKGKVYAYEIDEVVGMMGLKNVQNSGMNQVKYELADAGKNWAKNAPYDRIYSGAAFQKVPAELKDFLSIGGVAVIPTQDGNIKKIIRENEIEFSEENHYGFVFVPFIEEG